MPEDIKTYQTVISSQYYILSNLFFKSVLYEDIVSIRCYNVILRDLYAQPKPILYVQIFRKSKYLIIIIGNNTSENQSIYQLLLFKLENFGFGQNFILGNNHIHGIYNMILCQQTIRPDHIRNFPEVIKIASSTILILFNLKYPNSAMTTPNCRA